MAIVCDGEGDGDGDDNEDHDGEDDDVPHIKNCVSLMQQNNNLDNSSCNNCSFLGKHR